MALPRSVQAEALDGLSETDADAIRSRLDLQRVHLVMGTRGQLLRALRALRGMSLPQRANEPLRILELGAGDGSLMLRVARAWAPEVPQAHITLLDRQRLLSPATQAAYAKLGWRATAQVQDVHDWAAAAAAQPRWHLIVASLFLHHFKGAELAALLAAVAANGERFVACEPRRSRLALLGSHLIGALGVNAVTRADAVLSVHAGFCGQELSSVWPGVGSAWQVQERGAGLFSHLFVAQATAAR